MINYIRVFAKETKFLNNVFSLKTISSLFFKKFSYLGTKNNTTNRYFCEILSSERKTRKKMKGSRANLRELIFHVR